MIVDSQMHVWENETMNASHRQVRTFSAEDALAEMAAAGADAALIHPPSSLPNTSATAVAAAKAYPEKFAVLGHFAVETPENRGLVAAWKQQPGMLGFRFTFNRAHQKGWWTDGSLDWFGAAAEQAGTPVWRASPRSTGAGSERELSTAKGYPFGPPRPIPVVVDCADAVGFPSG